MTFGTYSEQFNPHGTVLASEAGKEYAVMHKYYPDSPHRGPWTLEKCQEWIDECIADGMKESIFYIIERDVSDWRKVNANV